MDGPARFELGDRLGELVEAPQALDRPSVRVVVHAHLHGGCKTVPSSMDAEVGRHAQSRAAQRDQRDYFAREGARGTNVGRRTFFGSIPGELCSASRASRSHVRAMSIRIDWTRELCSRSAICRHSAARSRHSAALIIGPCPLVPLILHLRRPMSARWPTHPSLIPLTVAVLVHLRPAGRLALRIASRLADSPSYRSEQGQPFASPKLQQRPEGLRATVCRLPLSSEP
jgi:hypothetical protein